MAAVLLTSGVLLLLLMAVDVFVTVFTPEGHGGPLTRRQARVLWSIWKRLAPRQQEKADYWLSLGGPVFALLAPATWALLLILGFALIFYPSIGGFLVSPGSLRAPWIEAVYYSAFSASTLGVGDLVADSSVVRILTVIEALSGFALLSASLSYILAIYRENGRKQTLASELALHYDLRQSSGAGWVQGRDLWLEHVARELLHITNAHAQYPILHFFRLRNRSGSLTLQLAPLLSATASDYEPSAGALPGAALVTAAVDRYLEAAQQRFIPAGVDTPRGQGDHRYLRLLRYLDYGPGDVALARDWE